jgi:hypothetical protein
MMGFTVFQQTMKSRVPPDTILVNLGGGNTTVLKYDTGAVVYKRGKSRFRVALADLYEAYAKFYGTRLTSSDLRKFKPSVFDSSAPHFGHSCNCTLLFMLLKEMGVVNQVYGTGVRGDPFSVAL